MPWICRSISERALKQAHLFSYCSQVAGDVPSRSRFKFFFHHCQALAKVKLEVDKLLKIKIEHDENITKQTMNCGEGGWNTIAKTFNKSRQFHYPCQSSFEMCEHLILVRYLIMNFSDIQGIEIALGSIFQKYLTCDRVQNHQGDCVRESQGRRRRRERESVAIWFHAPSIVCTIYNHPRNNVTSVRNRS